MESGKPLFLRLGRRSHAHYRCPCIRSSATGVPHGSSVREFRTGVPYGSSVREFRTGVPHGSSARKFHTEVPHGSSTRKFRTERFREQNGTHIGNQRVIIIGVFTLARSRVCLWFHFRHPRLLVLFVQPTHRERTKRTALVISNSFEQSHRHTNSRNEPTNKGSRRKNNGDERRHSFYGAAPSANGGGSV